MACPATHCASAAATATVEAKVFILRIASWNRSKVEGAEMLSSSSLFNTAGYQDQHNLQARTTLLYLSPLLNHTVILQRYPEPPSPPIPILPKEPHHPVATTSHLPIHPRNINTLSSRPPFRPATKIAIDSAMHTLPFNSRNPGAGGNLAVLLPQTPPCTESLPTDDPIPATTLNPQHLPPPPSCLDLFPQQRMAEKAGPSIYPSRQTPVVFLRISWFGV